MFDICRADDVEEVQMIDIPFGKGKTTAEEEHIAKCIQVDELKKKRTAIYASIMRGEKTLMRLVQKADPGDWDIFQHKMKKSFETLTQIMDNLQMIGFDRTPVEDVKYLNYTSRLKKMIAKIDHIMATQQAKIPGMIETLIDQYIQEETDFCENLIDPSTDDQDKCLDDKTGKDAADQQAKAADFNARMLKYRTSPAGTFSKPSLTKHPTSSKTQGASAQASSQQGAYAQAGAQLGSQPHPQFPNPPPPPPQQNFPQQQYGTQAAAGYPMRPQANYQGIPKLKVPTFDGEPSEFQRFKLTFHAAYDDRNLPQKHLALLLESVLKGRPLTIISEYMRTCIDDLSYARMWELLEERFGGKNIEDAFTGNMFKNAPQIKNGSLKEVERLYDVFSVQHAYYLANDPESLEKERSLLFQFGKEKLNTEFSMKFIWYTDKHDCVPNFTALMLFMKAEFLFVQTREREYSYLSTKSEVHSAKKALERCDLDDDDAKPLQTLSDAEEDRFPSKDDQYSYYVENQRTGKWYQAKGFRFAQMRPNLFQNRGNGGQSTMFRAIGFGGSKLSNLPRPPQPNSKFKEGQCSCCRQAHTLPDCPKFKYLTHQQQSTIIRCDKLCYHCLEGPHFTRDCKKNEGRKCGLDGCTLYHHRVLHRDPNSSKFIGYQIDDEMEPPPPSAEELAEVSNMYKISQNGAISIQTLICNVLSRKNKRGANVKTVVLIDSGSSITCINEDFALEHNLRVLDKREGMTLHMLERIVKLPEDQYHVELQLSSVKKHLCLDSKEPGKTHFSG